MNHKSHLLVCLSCAIFVWACTSDGSDSLHTEPLLETHKWVSVLLDDSVRLEQDLADRIDIQAKDLRRWLRKSPKSLDVDTLEKVLFALVDLGAPNKDLFIRSPQYLQVIALALQDSSSEIRAQASQYLLSSFTRDDLRKVESLIDVSNMSAEEELAFSHLLGWNIAIDSSAWTELLERSFVDSANFTDSLRLSEVPESMPFSDALYYHYARGLQEVWAVETPDVLQKLERIAARDRVLVGGLVTERLNWRLIQNFARLHESELKLCSGIALIKRKQTETALTEMGMTPRELWELADSLILEGWGFALTAPQDTAAVLFYRNSYVDPEGTEYPPIFLD